eukprot:5809521-Prymnesium_polylepis.1
MLVGRVEHVVRVLDRVHALEVPRTKVEAQRAQILPCVSPPPPALAAAAAVAAIANANPATAAAAATAAATAATAAAAARSIE